MIQIEELNVRYGGVHALKGISFEVPDNSIVTLLGANVPEKHPHSDQFAAW